MFLIAAVLPAGDRSEAPRHGGSFLVARRCDTHRNGIRRRFSIRSDRLENPDRLFFDLSGTKPDLGAKGITVIPVSDTLVRQIRVAETAARRDARGAGSGARRLRPPRRTWTIPTG